MKAVLGVLSLVIVLATMGFIARKQFQSLGGGESVRAAAEASSVAAARDVGGSGMSRSQPAKDTLDRARSDVARAVHDGAQRNADADR